MSKVAMYAQRAHSFFEEQGVWAEQNGIYVSPLSLAMAYSSGAIIGAVTDNDALPHDLRAYARNCRRAFREAIGVNQYRFETAPGTANMHRDWKGQLCLPHRSFFKIDPRKAYRERQLTGDCVSVAMRNMRDMSRCFDIDVRREAEDYVERSASADLYSMRGHTGAGASPSRIAMAAAKIGILLETEIESPEGEVWDFRNYDEYYKIGVKYGRTGLPQWIFDINREFGPKQIVEVADQDADQMLTVIWNGFGFGCGSNMGVSSKGGKDGLSWLSGLEGTWPHEMHAFGFDDRKKYHNDTLVFVDQTWGQWNNIGPVPEEYRPWPEGAFVVTLKDYMRGTRGGEKHAFSDNKGFRPRRQQTLGAEGRI